LAKKTKDASTVGSNRICSNGRSKENKYSNGIFQLEDIIGAMQPICYGTL